jgi:hypothetical protein
MKVLLLFCPQVPSCLAIRDSSPKHKDLTCNERSECESRRDRLCHPEQSEGSYVVNFLYFKEIKEILRSRSERQNFFEILFTFINIEQSLKPEAKNSNQCYTSFRLVVCKLKLFYKLPACRKDSANNDFHNNNKKTGV